MKVSVEEPSYGHRTQSREDIGCGAQLCDLGRGAFEERTVCGRPERLYERALALVETTLGTSHPITAEVLECYAELLVKTGRQAEAIAMKSRAEAAWNICIPRPCRVYESAQSIPACWQEREGSD